MKTIKYKNHEKAISVLKKARKHVERAHDDAETKHDSCGEFYMDFGLHEIMEETKKLLLEIDGVVTQLEG